jgi:DivIVA domain-containing protein
MGVELDPPLAESDKKKRNQRFASVRRGYDPTQVDDFLMTIASRIEALETEMHQEPISAEATPQGTDPAEVLPRPAAENGSEGYTQRIARLGAVGEREIERMLAEAKAEAPTIVAEARSEADRIMKDAQSEARRSVEEARAFLTQVDVDARGMLSGVTERRRQMIEELRKMQEHLVSVAQELDLVVNPIGPDADVPGGSTTVENGAGS